MRVVLHRIPLEAHLDFYWCPLWERKSYPRPLGGEGIGARIRLPLLRRLPSREAGHLE